MKKITLTIITLLVLTACSTPIQEPPVMQVSNFEECMEAGNPVMESYPRQCRHGDRTFTEEIDLEITPPTEGPDLEGLCIEAGGNWLSESHECEGVGEEACDKIGGVFNECASACRNDPTAEICTLQCVIVCQF